MLGNCPGNDCKARKHPGPTFATIYWAWDTAVALVGKVFLLVKIFFLSGDKFFPTSNCEVDFYHNYSKLFYNGCFHSNNIFVSFFSFWSQGWISPISCVFEDCKVMRVGKDNAPPLPLHLLKDCPSHDFHRGALLVLAEKVKGKVTVVPPNRDPAIRLNHIVVKSLLWRWGNGRMWY